VRHLKWPTTKFGRLERQQNGAGQKLRSLMRGMEGYPANQSAHPKLKAVLEKSNRALLWQLCSVTLSDFDASHTMDFPSENELTHFRYVQGADPKAMN
jgi:hypothetical protein